MNEAEWKLLKDWNGLMSNALAECVRLRWEKVRLYEMLIESDRWVRIHGQYGISRRRLGWTEAEIDKELRNGTGKD